MTEKKYAIVYDWMDKWGGVERILLNLHQMFPNAVFYTSHVDLEKAPWAKSLPLRATFMQKLPKFITRNRILSLLFYPFAFESIDLSEYDVVLSVTSSFAKAVITKPDTLHISYILTPTRFLWVKQEEYIKNRFLAFISAPVLTWLREWDFYASKRPDVLVALSEVVQQRITKYYQRQSTLVYPPFDTKYWETLQTAHTLHTQALREWAHSCGIQSSFYLVVSRLESYKKVDLAIKAMKSLPQEQLIIVGTGSKSAQLRKLAGKNCTFLGAVTEEQLAYLYANANAFIMPQEEDFGYVALEAVFFGCPVIAYRQGGAIETVQAGKTGIFFEKQTEEDLLKALAHFHTVSYNVKKYLKMEGKERVQRFKKNVFEDKIRHLISIS